jgi:DNA-binding NarL/FixJ family response regulator
MMRQARANEGKIRVLIVDDHELVRRGIQTVLNASPDIQVVGEASNGATAGEQVTHLHPDIVLMDIRLGQEDGIAVAQEWAVLAPRPQVIFLSGYVDDEMILKAVLAKAGGFVLKDTEADGLEHIIRTVASGCAWLDPRVMKRVLQCVCAGRAHVPGLPLSPQESRVLEQLAQGKTNKEIALALELSDKTVKNYLANVYDKLHVTRRSQAVAMYLTQPTY